MFCATLVVSKGAILVIQYTQGLQGVTIRNTYYTCFVLSMYTYNALYTRWPDLVYKGQYNAYIFIYIKNSLFPRAVNWGIRLTDHVAPCSCLLLLETAPARLLPALEARPLLQRTRRTRPGSQGKKIPCPIRPPVIFTDHEINPNAESFAAFQIEMTSPGFQEALEKAHDNPKSKEAGKS